MNLIFAILNFVLGVLVGMLIKRVFKIGIILLAIFVLAYSLGYTNITSLFGIVNVENLKSLFSNLPIYNIGFLFGIFVGLIFL